MYSIKTDGFIIYEIRLQALNIDKMKKKMYCVIVVLACLEAFVACGRSSNNGTGQAGNSMNEKISACVESKKADANTVSASPVTYAMWLRNETPERYKVNSQTFHEGKNEIRVVLLADDVLRVRVGPGGKYINDSNPEYTVVKTDDMWEGAKNLSDDPNVIFTGKMKVVVSYNPMTLNIYDAEGKPYIKNWVVDFSAAKAEWDIGKDEHIYGFGDVRGAIDKHGDKIVTRNSDTDYQYSDLNTGYKVLPMYWSSYGYGVFLHNWWPGAFDMGKTKSDRSRIFASGGEMDFYIFGGPTFTNIVDRYTQLTGRPAMVPRWVFGYHQGGAANSTSQNYAIDIASNMRKNNLPIDAIYYDDYRQEIFTPEFLCRMNKEFNVEITVGLGMPYARVNSEIWNKLDSLEPNGLIVDRKGVPSKYDANGYGHLQTEFDFFSDTVSDVVFDHIWKKPLQAGAWNGMVDFGEMDYVPDPAHTYFLSFNPPRTVSEMANVYSLVYFEQLVTRAAALKNSRYVGMPRAGTAGSQRYGWTFTGDSDPDWDGINGLQANLRSALSLSMSGFSTVGTDIGGWSGDDSDDLYVRWFQLAMFMPYAEAHGNGDKTIYGKHAAVMDICRDALNRRYQLIPYLYSLMFDAHLTGIPINRTLAFETNVESGTENVGDEFFCGPYILVAPMVNDSSSRTVRFPSGFWIDANDLTTTFKGGTTVDYPAALNVVPYFYKAGAIIPTGPIMQFTSELPLNPLTIDYFPASERTAFTLFEDDGNFGYESNKYSTTSLNAITTDDAITFTIAERNSRGGYNPGEREIVLKFHLVPEGSHSVSVNGKDIKNFEYDKTTKTITFTVKDDAKEKIVVVKAPKIGFISGNGEQ